MQKKTERQPKPGGDKPKRSTRQGVKSNRLHPAMEEKRRGQRSMVKSESTLLPYITEMLSERSKSAVKSILKHGQVFVNGSSVTHFDTPLNIGDEVFISHEKGRIEFNHPQLKIVWEDDELIVVDKAEGLLSVSDTPTQERTAYFLLNQYVKKINPRNKIFILHRLDKGTSGLMMFAKNPEIQEYLRSNWHRMITRRSYAALIEGVPEKKKDTIITYLAENSRMKVYCTDPENGKEAISHYTVVKSNTQHTLIELDLETGRKNQIRAQMEYIGHPVAGDPKYGAQTDPAGRLMLHARRLFFIHPATGVEMRFETPMPKKFTPANNPNPEQKATSPVQKPLKQNKKQ
jgi:pseudouridine synthase, RluA family